MRPAGSSCLCPLAAVLAVVLAPGLAGCSRECVGAGCDTVFQSTLLAVILGDAKSTYGTVRDPLDADLLVEGGAEEGSGWSIAPLEGEIAAGMPDADAVRLLASPERRRVSAAEIAVAELGAEDSGDRFGAAVARVPDMDGDGAPELLVGASARDGGGSAIEAGAAYLFLGAGQGWSDGAEPRLRVSGESPMQHLGGKLAGCEDLDGDGLGDALVASLDSGDAASLGGRVDLLASSALPELGAQVLAGQLASSWWAGGTGDQLGRAMVCPQDLDGDARRELLLAAPFADDPGGPEAAGAIWLLPADPPPASGPVEQAATRVLRGMQDEAWLGWAMATGDLDGDGLPDLAAGAPGADGGRGAVYVYLGSDLSAGTDTPSLLLRGGQPMDHLGAGVAIADVDGDGADDLLAGAPREAPEGTAAAFASGSIHVFAGGERFVSAVKEIDIADADLAWHDPQGYLRTGAEIPTAHLDGDERADMILPLGYRP